MWLRGSTWRGESNPITLDEPTQAPRDQSQVSVFDATVRWVLGNRSQPINSKRFLFFTCKQAQDAASNGVKPGKQNNLRPSTFDHLWITWLELTGPLFGVNDQVGLHERKYNGERFGGHREEHWPGTVIPKPEATSDERRLPRCRSMG